MFRGPGLKHTPEDLEAIHPFAIDSWFSHQPFHNLAEHKVGQLQQFESKFVSKFSSYFAELGPPMKLLFKMVFPSNNFYECLATHDSMLQILNAVFMQLPDEEPCTPDPSPTKGRTPSQISSHSIRMSMKLQLKRLSRMRLSTGREDSGFESNLEGSLSSSKCQKLT